MASLPHKKVEEEKPKEVAEQAKEWVKGIVKKALGAVGFEVEDSAFFAHDVASVEVHGTLVDAEAAVESTVMIRGNKKPKEPEAPAAPAKAKSAKSAGKK